ncbi:unnamed protein product, partial [Oikopleura dioica]
RRDSVHELVEIDEDKIQDGLYIEAKHSASDVLKSHIMHLRECTSYNFEKIGENSDGSAIYEDEPSATYAFLNDGCIAGDFKWYSQKSSGDRTDWTLNTATYVKDQFNMQLLADAGSSSGSSKLKYSCGNGPLSARSVRNQRAKQRQARRATCPSNAPTATTICSRLATPPSRSKKEMSSKSKKLTTKESSTQMPKMARSHLASV